MFHSRSAVLGLVGLAVALLLGAGCAPVSVAAAPPTPSTDATGTHVMLSAAASTTSWDERDADVDRVKFDLPLLILHRGREATDAAERTLQIRLSGLEAGSAVWVEAQSIHADVTTGERHTQTAHFLTPDRPCSADAPCTLR